MKRFAIRVGAMAGKEILHIQRDPRVLYMALGMPVVLLLLFGYGISFDVQTIRAAVVDLDRTRASRELQRRFGEPEVFRIEARPTHTDAVIELLRRGEVRAALVIPHGFQRAVATGREARLQLLMDGSDNNTATQAMGKAEAIVRVAGNELARKRTRLPRSSPPLQARVWLRFNRTAASPLYLVPGLTAYILAIVSVMLTALTVAREWEQGSMAQLFATPVGRLEIIAGKLLPYLGIGVICVLLTLAIGAWVFDVPVRGSLLMLALSSLLFLLGMLGQGLLISVLTRNQMVATQAGALSSMLPSLIFSGFIFPVENMPRVLQWFAALVPARYYVHCLRGILLRGNGFAELWPQALALLAFASAMVWLSALRFRRRLA